MPAHPFDSPRAPSQRFVLMKGEAVALVGMMGAAAMP